MAFMKKKTKQRCKTILSLFFALTLIMSAVTFAVSAAEAAALSVQLKTDKEEYTADEDIALTLEIRNGSTGRLVDIAYDITAPDGYELKSGSASGGETELLAGGTLKFDNVYSAVKATPDNPSTDGRINPTVPLISAVICAAALVALNRKKAKKMLASLLCVSLLLTALPLDVAAEEIGKAAADTADVTVTKDITAGGAKKTFTARVTAGKTADSVTVRNHSQSTLPESARLPAKAPGFRPLGAMPIAPLPHRLRREPAPPCLRPFPAAGPWPRIPAPRLPGRPAENFPAG